MRARFIRSTCIALAPFLLFYSIYNAIFHVYPFSVFEGLAAFALYGISYNLKDTAAVKRATCFFVFFCLKARRFFTNSTSK